MAQYVVKYDDRLKDSFYLKTKPEPWMHLVVSITEADGNARQVFVAVYVWDTRTIIETSRNKLKAVELVNPYVCLKAADKPADSHIALNGENAAALNAELHWKKQ